MLDHIISTRFGIKLLYVSLLLCFLFFTAFIVTSVIPGKKSLPNGEPALHGQDTLSTTPEVQDSMANRNSDETYVRPVLQNDSFSSINFSVKDIDALVAFLVETDSTKHSDRIHFLSDNYGQIHPNKYEPFQNKPGK